MARDNRIGPYITYRAMKNRDGLYRVTYEERLTPQDIFDIGHELDRIEIGSRRGSQLVHEYKDVVFGYARPLDDILHNVWLYTNFDYWRAHHARWMPTYPHRVCIHAHITSHDNLTVTLSTRCLSRRGTWEPAEEWRSDPFFGTGGFRQRPVNEALFLRDVSDLFDIGQVSHGRDMTARSAQCKAVLASFWLTMERLSSFFEPHFGNYIAGLTEKPITWDNQDEPLVGLEIVDGLAEYREWLRQELARFEQKAGHTPESFYEVCEATRRGWSYDLTSKKIRHVSRGSVDLVPSAIRDLHDFLNKAKDYGLWTPDTVRAGLWDDLRKWTERFRVQPQTAFEIWYSTLPPQMSDDEKVKLLRRQSHARIEIAPEAFQLELDRIMGVMRRLGIEPQRNMDRPSTKVPSQIDSPKTSRATPPKVSKRPMDRGRGGIGDNTSPRETVGSRSPPAYPRRTYSPGSDELAELGVTDARELVDLMNSRLIADKQFPVTAGDYPTSKTKFEKLARRWRAMNGGYA